MRPRVYNVEPCTKSVVEDVQSPVSTTLVETEIDDDSTPRDSEVKFLYDNCKRDILLGLYFLLVISVCQNACG